MGLYRATPKTPATPVTKNISPTHSPEIQGWDFNWLELLEWLEEGGSLATNNSSKLRSRPALYFRRILRVDVFGWATRCGPGISENGGGVLVPGPAISHPLIYFLERISYPNWQIAACPVQFRKKEKKDCPCILEVYVMCILVSSNIARCHTLVDACT